MDVDGHGIAGDSGSGHGHLNNAATGGGAGSSAGAGGRCADGVVGDASGAVAVPCASADGAGRRDVGQQKIRAAVVVSTDGNIGALTCSCAGRLKLARLSPGERNAGGLGLENDSFDLAG
jgi:hypothetical protein